MNDTFVVVLVWIIFVGSLILNAFTLYSVGVDRRDVNRDGNIDIVDLSVLATEIDAIKSPYCPE